MGLSLSEILAISPCMLSHRRVAAAVKAAPAVTDARPLLCNVEVKDFYLTAQYGFCLMVQRRNRRAH